MTKSKERKEEGKEELIRRICKICEIEYVDFTEPENFVKLFELKRDYNDDGLFWGLPPIKFCCGGVRLAFLYTFLDSLLDMNVRRRHQIIKAIKETQWKI